MPIRWKVFKAIAIVQLIMLTFKAFTAFAGLFYSGYVFNSLLEIFTYGCMLAFVTLGFSVVNYNYPETPLSVSRKRWFNYLFLLNFLLIAVLFAKVIGDLDWIDVLMNVNINFSGVSKIYYYFLIVQNTLIFLIHLFFLLSMYKLRKEIYSNSVGTWVEEFKPDTHRDETRP
jgi:hypothetical protein